ncbi:MAG: hypothetical protein DRR06_04325 [Gammaproteobacteria bacterium]|nr:MAG: hypothetical protein DRR06_04325 [Gammaproteobacteria bacterium]
MIKPLINSYSSAGVQHKLMLPAAGFSLVVGLFLLPALWFYLDGLGQQQSDKLGQALVTQLADQVRQPLLHNDTISLQFVVNDLVRNTDAVLHAAVYNTEDKLQVQGASKQYREGNRASVYAHQITLENSTAGQARLTIDSATIKSDLLVLFWSTLYAWLLLSSILCIGLHFVGRRISKRLVRIISGLPTHSKSIGNDEISNDEIGQLEANIKPLLIKPLLTKPESCVNDDEEILSLTLTIRCENIERLQAQLSQENYRRLLTNFDAVTDCAAKLYDAARLAGSQHCIHLRFYSNGNISNALLRAISSYLAITEILKASAPRAGAELRLCGALGETGTQTSETRFSQDHQQELALQKLVKTTALADSWQLLIQASLLDDAAHKSVFNCEPLPNAADQMLFMSLATEQQTTLTGQLTYLHSLLPELAAPSSGNHTRPSEAAS